MVAGAWTRSFGPRPSRSSGSGRWSRSCPACCGALRPRGGRRVAAPRGRGADRLSGLPRSPLPAAAPRRRAAHLLRQPAGLGLAPLESADDRRARAPHHHALSLRDRDLPAPRRRCRLRRAPARRGRRRRGSRSPRRCRRRPGGASCCCPAAGRGRSSATGRRCPRPLPGCRRRIDLEVVAVRAPGSPERLRRSRRARDRGRLDRPAPDPRVGRPRVRRLGHGDARDGALRRADGRRLPDLGR